MKVNDQSLMVVKVDMVNDRERDMCGLGLTIDDVVDRSVVGINIATTKNNSRGNIIVVVFDDTCR